jgi:hypothetical protein
MVDGFLVGLGVRDGAVTGNGSAGDAWLYFVITAFVGAEVGDGAGLVGGLGVTSASQAANKTQNTKITKRFIRGSIAGKN